MSILRTLALALATLTLAGPVFGQSALNPPWPNNRGYNRSTVYQSMVPRPYVPAPKIEPAEPITGRPQLQVPARTYQGSLPIFSPEWLAYCGEKYNSFNPRTGKYLSYGGVYRTCR